MEWLFVIFGVILAEIGKAFYRIAKREIFEYRRKKIVHVVQVKFPNNSKVTYASVDSSDKRAMDKILRQLLDQGTLTEDDLDEYEMEPFLRVDPYPKTESKK